MIFFYQLCINKMNQKKLAKQTNKSTITIDSFGIYFDRLQGSSFLFLSTLRWQGASTLKQFSLTMEP